MKGVETVYIGYTTRSLKRRLMEHIYKGRVSKDSTIQAICTKSSKSEAVATETTLINLIGLHRLINKDDNSKRTYQSSMSEDGKKKVSEFHKGKKWALGRIMTKEEREKLSKRLTGIKKNKEKVYQALKNKGNKEFDLFLNGALVGTFVSQTEAARSVGLKKSTFVDIYSGKRKKTKGIKVVFK